MPISSLRPRTALSTPPEPSARTAHHLDAVTAPAIERGLVPVSRLELVTARVRNYLRDEDWALSPEGHWCQIGAVVAELAESTGTPSDQPRARRHARNAGLPTRWRIIVPLFQGMSNPAPAC